MAHCAEIECPQCWATIEVKVDRDTDYGSDADGNRGSVAYSAEITKRHCKCELTSHQEEFVEDAAIEEAR